MSDRKVVGAIEAGGTKWVCAMGYADGEILEEVVVPTRSPDETMPLVRAAFDQLQERHGAISGIGIASFGPLGVNPDKASYGVIQETPKEGWKGFDYLSEMRACLGEEVVVTVDTDVNAAALAEIVQPEHRDCSTLIYVTVGTGIGGGVVADGKIWHGRGHPEIGHLLVPESSLEPEPGFSSCPFHQNCIEGKASGTAMRKRWGSAPTEWPDDHPGWELEAEYLAGLVVILTAVWVPDRVVFGGGVVQFGPLLPMVRKKFVELAGNYWDTPPVGQYIMPSSLRNRAGLSGALMLSSRD